MHRRTPVPFKTAWHALVATALLALSACASQSTTPAISAFQLEQAKEEALAELNALIANQSTVTETAPESYRVGPGDLLKVQVFGVEELDREVRVDGRGKLTLPLIGETHVGGKTVREVEQLIAARYEESYLRNPQINVLVEEYRARRIAVLGAVKAPKVYSVERSVRVIEALAMAGGLDKEAGGTVYVTDRIVDPDSGQPMQRKLIIHLDELLQSGASVDDAGENQLNVLLGEGATVTVPKAGVVYVEGAVHNPGAYTMQGETTVLKAVAMAGGLKFEARGSSIKVLKNEPSAQANSAGSVDIDHVRAHPKDDILLSDGDVVVVETNQLKAGVSTLFKTARGFFGFGIAL